MEELLLGIGYYSGVGLPRNNIEHYRFNSNRQINYPNHNSDTVGFPHTHRHYYHNRNFIHFVQFIHVVPLAVS